MNQCITWSDGVSEWLIHYAASRAPGALSERLEEEWLADLAERSQGSPRLRFALGCCWATRVIAHEHQPAQVRVAGTVMGAKLAFGDAHHTLSYFSRRSSTLFVVVSLHIALFYVLMTKLSHTQTTLPPPPFVNAVLKDAPPKILPPPPKPDIERTILKVDRPEVEIPPEVDPTVDRVTAVIDEPPRQQSLPPPQPPPAHVVQRTAGGPGAGFPNAEDFYPDAAKRLGEQGIATVQVCVDAKGRLTSEPATLQSTGSARLDEGALKLAGAASGHYRASTEDGKPVNSCYPFRIRFQLKN